LAQQELAEMEKVRNSLSSQAQELNESLNSEAISILLTKKQQISLELSALRQVNNTSIITSNAAIESY
jgi:hypothetical protein